MELSQSVDFPEFNDQVMDFAGQVSDATLEDIPELKQIRETSTYVLFQHTHMENIQVKVVSKIPPSLTDCSILVQRLRSLLH